MDFNLTCVLIHAIIVVSGLSSILHAIAGDKTAAFLAVITGGIWIIINEIRKLNKKVGD